MIDRFLASIRRWFRVPDYHYIGVSNNWDTFMGLKSIRTTSYWKKHRIDSRMLPEGWIKFYGTSAEKDRFKNELDRIGEQDYLSGWLPELTNHKITASYLRRY